MQNKSQLGGILSIISGAFGIIGFIVMIAMILFFRYIINSPTFGDVGSNVQEPFRIVFLIYGIMGLVLLIIGTIGIVGGIYAIKKRLWGLALAGAICGIITFFPTGVIATIFVAQAQKEFSPSPNPVDAGMSGTLSQP